MLSSSPYLPPTSAIYTHQQNGRTPTSRVVHWPAYYVRFRVWLLVQRCSLRYIYIILPTSSTVRQPREEGNSNDTTPPLLRPLLVVRTPPDYEEQDEDIHVKLPRPLLPPANTRRPAKKVQHGRRGDGTKNNEGKSVITDHHNPAQVPMPLQPPMGYHETDEVKHVKLSPAPQPPPPQRRLNTLKKKRKPTPTSGKRGRTRKNKGDSTATSARRGSNV